MRVTKMKRVHFTHEIYHLNSKAGTNNNNSTYRQNCSNSHKNTLKTKKKIFSIKNKKDKASELKVTILHIITFQLVCIGLLRFLILVRNMLPG